MRVEIQSAAYSAEPQNASITFVFIPETQVEVNQLTGLLINKPTTTATFAQVQGRLTGSFVIAPAK
jgi:hypothetical protein